jgi:hypothetical protein
LTKAIATTYRKNTSFIAFKNLNIVFGFSDMMLGFPNIVLRFFNIMLRFLNIVFGFSDMMLGFPNIVLRFFNIVFGFFNIVLKYFNTIFRFLDVVLRFSNTICEFFNVVLKFFNIVLRFPIAIAVDAYRDGFCHLINGKIINLSATSPYMVGMCCNDDELSLQHAHKLPSCKWCWHNRHKLNAIACNLLHIKLVDGVLHLLTSISGVRLAD